MWITQMQTICVSLQDARHASTPPLPSLQGRACPYLPPRAGDGPLHRPPFPQARGRDSDWSLPPFKRTSPNIWLISGDVTKSPAAPNTSRCI